VQYIRFILIWKCYQVNLHLWNNVHERQQFDTSCLGLL